MALVLNPAVELLSGLHSHQASNYLEVSNFEQRVNRSRLAADAYLRGYAKEHVTRTDTGIEIDENFSQFLIFEVTGDEYVLLILLSLALNELS